MPRMNAVVTALNVYPVKSCAGIALHEAEVQDAGFAFDRQWLVVTPEGRFLTQRERPKLALVGTSLAQGRLVLRFPDGSREDVVSPARGRRLDVVIWDDRCSGLDCGDAVADRLSALLGAPVRLVEFDAAVPRLKRSPWLGDATATIRYPDGYPVLLLSEESLADLNARLPEALPMNRFRPNVVVRGLGAFGEDRVRELRAGELRLRPVKPCVRCTITMTDQSTATVDPAEPLRTLKGYRWDRELRGITFGQNVAIAGGAGARLRVGQVLEVDWKT
jgi:uncharacterized protein YcbX